MSRPPASTELRMDRFFAKVDATGGWSGCWIWLASLDRHGYGLFNFAGGRGGPAHRYSYSAGIGAIPEGAQIDHLCRVRRCVNPMHLEPVSSRENTMRSPIAVTAVYSRQQACKHGHDYTPENLYLINGRRRCRACARRNNRDAYARRRAAESA